MSKVLVLDDEPRIRTAMGQLLREWGHDVLYASTCDEAQAMLLTTVVDIAFIDVVLPDGSGLDLIRKVREQGVLTAIVFLTGHGTIEDAVRAIRLGAEDYFTKPVEPSRLRILLDKLCERIEMEEEVRTLRRQLTKVGAGPLVGQSAAMQQVYTLIERVAPTNASVFITGESGTGKTLFAQTIHHYSKRRKKPFVAVNCAAIPPSLIESELFGHEKGSFTGALATRRGLFEEANTGTIFLDEVTEMPVELQAKLLHVLEEGRVRRVGGNCEFEIDVRMISATNRDPMGAVKEGKLREDLYYRMNIFPIHAPGLRERPDDVPLLSQTFLDKICEEEGRKPCRFDARALQALMDYSWPGNVRELRNAINRAVIVARGEVISEDCLPDFLHKQQPTPAPDVVLS